MNLYKRVQNAYEQNKTFNRKEKYLLKIRKIFIQEIENKNASHSKLSSANIYAKEMTTDDMFAEIKKIKEILKNNFIEDENIKNKICIIDSYHDAVNFIITKERQQTINSIEAIDKKKRDKAKRTKQIVDRKKIEIWEEKTKLLNMMISADVNTSHNHLMKLLKIVVRMNYVDHSRNILQILHKKDSRNTTGEIFKLLVEIKDFSLVRLMYNWDLQNNPNNLKFNFL